MSMDLTRLAEDARDRAVLVQTTGGDAGRVVRLEGERVSLGRGKGCDASFDDDALSREHAEVRRLGPRVFVVDSGSKNGTFVNGERVTQVKLAEGDTVRLGKNVGLRFQWVTAEEQRAMLDAHASSTRDPLTGLANRRYLDQRLGSEVAYAVRHGTPLAVLAADVDHFKRVNDTWGHATGDAVLQRLAAVLVGTVRLEDLVARVGGEELLVVVRGATAAAGAMMAERVRREVARTSFMARGERVPVTLSIGVATLACCGGERTAAALTARADARLYRAKREGRDRIVWNDGT